MLVLSRRVEQYVEARISREQALRILSQREDIRIQCKVVEVRPFVVRLGFTAPGDVVIHRDEVWGEIDQLIEAGRRR